MIVPIIRLRRCLLAAGVCLVLTACENPLLDEAPSLETILSKGWLSQKMGLDGALAPTPPIPVQPVYCYETIGVGDCYDAPLEGSENRLVGFDGPAPAPEPLPAKP